MNKKIAMAALAMTFVTGAANAYYGSDNKTVNYYNEWGQKTGSAKEGYNGTVNYYNEWGQKTGSAKEGYNGTVNYYNEWGQKVGSSR